MSKLFNNKYGLSVNELTELNMLYEAHCTAEYLLENHYVKDENLAIELGYEVRHKMSKYDYSESEAIHLALDEHGLL